MEQPALQVDPADTVATALRDLSLGDQALGVTLSDAVPRGHKFALLDHASGEEVVKLGFRVGRATASIAPGAHVHSHNLASALSDHMEYRFERASLSPQRSAARLDFSGYLREDGRVGTRNEIWILPTVGCVARTAQKIAVASQALHNGRVDGVYAFVHPFGCSQLGEDLAGTRAILAALASHPNAGGVLLVGLGCESNQLDILLQELDPGVRGRVRTLHAQSTGDEHAEGLKLVEELVDRATLTPRAKFDINRLVLGVKCGGSDGLSGLTANPLVGRMSDRVSSAGGTVVLTEIPEIFGAEHLLMARASSRAVFDSAATMVNGFKRYFLDHGETVSENPSPGNIAGGITTLEEKSLGAVQKAGHAELTDVIAYGQRATKPGLTLLEAPGNDAVSSTALAAAGATVILFTTGRGTPLGFPVPTIKISSNSSLAARKPGWIDFDAGVVIDQGRDSTADALMRHILLVASGAQTAAERNGEREMAIWKRGVTL